MRTKLAAVLTLFAALLCQAQQPNLNLVTPPPLAPSGIIAAYTGPAGPAPQAVYYWVVARYPAGLSPSTGAVTAVVPGGMAGISPIRTVRISWQLPAGATGFDILRSNSTFYPGTCAACVAFLNVTTSPQIDTGAALPYPPSGLSNAPGASAVFSINNTQAGAPFPQVSLNGAAPQAIRTGPDPAAPVQTVFGQVGNVNIPVTTGDIGTPAPPVPGDTTWYTKGGQFCSESPTGQ